MNYYFEAKVLLQVGKWELKKSETSGLKNPSIILALADEGFLCISLQFSDRIL